jgi:hypothetical protein
MNRLSLLIVLGGLVVASSGCVVIDSAKEMGRYTKRTFTFRPSDYRDTTEEPQNDWKSAVGEEGRGNQPRLREPDRLWRKLFMSETARSIDRNVGID